MDDLAEVWERYEAERVPVDATNEQRLEVKRAYYVGAAAALTAIQSFFTLIPHNTNNIYREGLEIPEP